MLTVSRRRPSWSLAWATWTSPWVSTPTVTRVGWACAMVVMAISLRLRAWGGWHAPAGWADSTAMGLWHRLLSGHACSAGGARRWPRRRADRSGQGHEAGGPLGSGPYRGHRRHHRSGPLAASRRSSSGSPGCATTPGTCGGCCAGWAGAPSDPPGGRPSVTRPRSPAGGPRNGPGSRGGAEPRRLELLSGRVRLFAAPAGAADLGAQGADPDLAPPRPLEAGLHGRDLLLPAGWVAGPAVLPQPARQLQRPHPDRRPQAAAPLPARRARDLDLGQPALPPQPGDGRLAGDPVPLAPGRVPARLRPRPGPGGGADA